MRLLLGHPHLEVGPLAAGSSAGARVTDAPPAPHRPGANAPSSRPTPTPSPRPTWSSWRCRTASPARSQPTCRHGTVVVDLGADHRLRAGRGLAALLRRPARRHVDLRHARARRPARADPDEPAHRQPRLLPDRRHPRPGSAAGGRVSSSRRTSSWSPRAARPAPAASPATRLLASTVMGQLIGVQGRRHAPAHARDRAGALPLAAGEPVTRVLHPGPRTRCRAASSPPPQPGSPRASTTELLHEALHAAYADEPFVHVLPVRRVAADRRDARQQRCAPAGGRRPALAVAPSWSSAIDNLVKGAAGQALQNANLVLGLDESAGLTEIGVAP